MPDPGRWASWSGRLSAPSSVGRLTRAVPTVLEYRTIRNMVDRIAASPPPTVAGIREAFEKQREIDYTVDAITGKDLSITKENDKVVISFAYTKEIELIAPVFLVIKYEGRSK
jgi:hypothetical protein